MSIDQAHEQNNGIIKSHGGAVGITEDPSALLRWMVAGPELGRLVKEYEASSELKSKVDVRHHEETPSAQSKFAEQVQSLISVISETGNPLLEESSDLLVLDTKYIVDPGIAKKVKDFRETGEQQFSSFWNKLYKNDTKFFHDRNNFTFFSILHAKEGPRNRVKLDRNLFSRLFIASQTQAVDLDEFFKFENSPFPASLSENGNVYFTQSGTMATLFVCNVSSWTNLGTINST